MHKNGLRRRNKKLQPEVAVLETIPSSEVRIAPGRLSANSDHDKGLPRTEQAFLLKA